MNGLNGIIYGGKIYTIEKSEELAEVCEHCDLRTECNHRLQVCGVCNYIDEDEYFRFSQELTDKMNK